MEEMYIKTVPLIGIANNYQKEIDNLNRRLFSSIVNMYKATPIDNIYSLLKRKEALYINGEYKTIMGLLINKDKQIIFLDALEEAPYEIENLPIEAKYQLVKLLDSENG